MATTKKAAVKKERKAPVRRTIEEKALAEFNRTKVAYERAAKRLKKANDEIEKAEAAAEAAAYEFDFWNNHPAIPDDVRIDYDAEAEGDETEDEETPEEG